MRDVAFDPKAQPPTPYAPPATVEQPGVRFGEMALRLKLLTAEQVEDGLRAQESGRADGLDRSIGAWLHDKGHLDLVKVQTIMDALGYPPRLGHLIPGVVLKRLLGRGASGAVYRGFSYQLDMDVAVKVRAPKASNDDPEGKRFRREAGFALRLDHPNVVRVYDAGETRDFIYHVLEYVDGRPLDQLVRERGHLPEGQVAAIGAQVAAALIRAAEEGIVHRDIKPANILLAEDGQAKLCDLGLAKDLTGGPALTASGLLLGSPFYISPEYAQKGQLDVRSDIYGLGVTLYHCACGKVPFTGKGVLEILENVVKAETPDPRTIRPGLRDDLAEVILRMMRKDPEARYQTPLEVIEALEPMREAGAAAPRGAAPVGLLRRLLQRLRFWR